MRSTEDSLRGLGILLAASCDEREAAAGAVRASAGDARQGDKVHRTLQGTRLARRPGTEPGEEAGEDRKSGAAEAAPDRFIRFPAGATLRRRCGELEKRAEDLWHQAHL